MMYVIGVIYAILMGAVGGWFCYNICADSKKSRLGAGILCGIGIAIISVLAAFGG